MLPHRAPPSATPGIGTRFMGGLRALAGATTAQPWSVLGNWLEAAGPWVPQAAEGSAGTGAPGRSWRCRQCRAEMALAASEVCPASTGGGAGWSVQLTQAEGLRRLRPGSSSWEAHCARLLICLSTLTRCRVLAPDHLSPQVKIFLSLLGWTKE